MVKIWFYSRSLRTRHIRCPVFTDRCLVTQILRLVLIHLMGGNMGRGAFF